MGPRWWAGSAAKVVVVVVVVDDDVDGAVRERERDLWIEPMLRSRSLQVRVAK